ncbi:MAG: hypothetical protein QM308_01740 [Bacillota bacterium]|nr:hypothetical protein [Bacillota bacterium]
MTENAFPVYDAYTKSIDCYLKPGADAEAVFSWLTGRGNLLMGNEPGRRYEARVNSPIELRKFVKTGSYRSFTVVFVVQPFKFLDPPADPIQMSDSSLIINNPTNANAMPAVFVSGTGAGTITINGVVVSISNLSNGILMNWLAMEITTWSGLYNRASYVTGGPQWLVPGDNTITKSAAITTCTIQPNWCYL